jgi:uncharacterized integral membrane protein
MGDQSVTFCFFTFSARWRGEKDGMRWVGGEPIQRPSIQPPFGTEIGMKAPTLLLLVVLTVIVVFAAVNWSVITAPATVSLLVTDVQAPLGLIMFGLTVLVTVLFLIFVAYLQTSVLLDTRRHSRELRAQRELADQAEASRFTDLRAFIETELRKLAAQVAESRAGVTERLDQAEQNLRTTIEQSGNSLAAYIGELEDRLLRTGETGNQRGPG